MLDFALLSYVAVMSITPGPNNLMLATSGVNFGFQRTLPHVFGVSIGHAVQVTLTATLLVFILAGMDSVRLPLAVAGCVYLLWLSWQILRAGSPEARDSARPMSLFGAALFQWVNPKAWIMVLNAAILFMPRDGHDPATALWLGLICATINLPCIAVWALAGDRLRHWLSSPAALRVFNTVMATLMAATALWLLVDELPALA